MTNLMRACTILLVLVAAAVTAQGASSRPALASGTTAPPSPSRPRIGDPAPAFDLPTLDGQRLGRDALIGQVTVVEFFATWCLPCARSLEDLRAVQGGLAGPGPGVNLLIIAADDPATLRAHLAQHPAPAGALIALDPQRLTGRRWGQDRFPTSFFVDRTGIIRHINRGHGPGFRVRAAAWLRGMLALAPNEK